MAGLAMVVVVGVVAGCAKGGPGRPQDGGTRDAHAGLDAGPTPDDGGEEMFDAMPIDAPIDAPIVEPDAWTPPPIDAWVPPPIDGGPPPGTGAYLDRCVADRDCASGRCTDDVGATRFCTRACSSDALCAHEHTCVGGFCVPEDTGAPCNVATPATCAHACLGSAAGGQCTRPCASADECPSGYACTEVGDPPTRVCVDIEHPCGTGADCGTGLCFTDVGCTATCRTVADCPRQLTSIGVLPYTCEFNSDVGASICVPSNDVIGPDPIGAACSPFGLVECRSTACDDGAPLGPMCTQACTARGGCARGLGCQPVPADASSFVLTCQRAGNGDIGQSCGAGRDCHSSLCDTAGYCTRLCADGLCPTGMSCMPVPGAGVAICRR